jgi:hypothetical protein
MTNWVGDFLKVMANLSASHSKINKDLNDQFIPNFIEFGKKLNAVTSEAIAETFGYKKPTIKSKNHESVSVSDEGVNVTPLKSFRISKEIDRDNGV